MEVYQPTMEIFNPPLPPEAKLLMNKLKKGKILRYKIDIFSVAAVISAVAIQFIAYWYQWPWYSLLLIIILMRESNLAEHNHSHLTIFKNNLLNESIGWLMFLNCGIPLQSYRETHVYVHHRHIGTPEDWTSPWDYQGTTFPGKPVNKIYYIATLAILSILHCSIIFLRKPLSKSTIRFVVSMIVVSVTVMILALYDFRSFMIFYAVPWLITYSYLGIAALRQHVDCQYDSLYTMAINDFNIDSCNWGFNIGYHTAHHWYPHLHWSLLEEFHDTYLAPHISPEYYTPIWFSLKRRKERRSQK